MSGADDDDTIGRLRWIMRLCEAELADQHNREAGSPELAGVALANRLLRLHRRRDDLLGADLFPDPAWNMLLDLYVNEAKGRPISVSSLCGAAATPATTALRWIGVLVERGLVVREVHPTDGRGRLVRLLPTTQQALGRLLGDL